MTQKTLIKKSGSHIAIVVTYNDHFEFFCRAVPAIRKAGFEPVILTDKYSIVRAARRIGLLCYLLHKTDKPIEYDVSQALEVIEGSLTQPQAKVLFSSAYRFLSDMHGQFLFRCVMLWNGYRTIEKGARAAATDLSIPTVFIELSNFPKKIFADPIGTNAASYLSAHPEILSLFPDRKEEYEAWKKSYIEAQLKQHSVPQSAGKSKIAVKRGVLDLIGKYVFGAFVHTPVFTWKKLFNKLSGKRQHLQFDTVSLQDERYIFFPMQVSDDSQILINSTVDNEAALRICAAEAAKRNCKLFVKPHPAERNTRFEQNILSLRKELGFLFVQGNTTEIMMHAEAVFTINSTAGLQAKIFGKEVTCFGNAFYAAWDEESIRRYITGYLIDADVWGKEEVSAGAAAELINRASLGKSVQKQGGTE